MPPYFPGAAGEEKGRMWSQLALRWALGPSVLPNPPVAPQNTRIQIMFEWSASSIRCLYMYIAAL